LVEVDKSSGGGGQNQFPKVSIGRRSILGQSLDLLSDTSIVAFVKKEEVLFP